MEEFDNDHDELNHLMKKPARPDMAMGKIRPLSDKYCGEEDCAEEEVEIGNQSQWTTADNAIFCPISATIGKLPPGVYEIDTNPAIGLFFSRMEVDLDGLIRFPDSNSDKVIEEVQKFWARKEVFISHNIHYKRGIILWGPPGSGKSCTVQFIMKDVVDKGGIVVKFTHPIIFNKGMRVLRRIEPETPVIVIMEDMDGILEMYNESDVLQILDGIDQIQNVVFLATTNYPQCLGARIINRPSRFDKRFKIGHPNAECRRVYFEHIMQEEDEDKIDLDKWVMDTEDFSIAHLKELYVAVIILDDSYGEAIKTLRDMKEDISSDDDKDKVGFI